MNLQKWRKWAVPAGILAFAAFLRLAGIDKSLWMDEAGSHAQATATDFFTMARAYDHPPLYFALLRAGCQFTDSFSALRLFSVMCGMATVALFCFWPGAAPTTRWLAGLLAATSPLMIFHSQELRHYALLVLELSTALAFAERVLQSPGNVASLAGLAVSLALAAATHLQTAFFLVALFGVLVWELRTEPFHIRRRVAVAFAPAGFLAVYFKCFFLSAATKDPNFWWMPPLSLRLLGQILSELLGIGALVRLTDAFQRHAPGSGPVFLVLAALGACYVGWIAWGQRGRARILLILALLYWCLIVAYSAIAVPLVWPRTFLPGLIALLLSIAMGLATHEHAGRRRIATGIVALLAVAMTVPWLRGRAYESGEDLRGLAEVLARHTKPNDLLVLVGGVEWGLRPYWPDYAAHRATKIDLQTPVSTSLTALQHELAHNSANDATLLVYREDFYLGQRRAVLQDILRTLSHPSVRDVELWNRTYYRVRSFSSLSSGVALPPVQRVSP